MRLVLLHHLHCHELNETLTHFSLSALYFIASGLQNIITTYAGNTGKAGSSGDGGAAASAQLNGPIDLVIDISVNLFISDTNNYKIRKVNNAGIITTFAGTGTLGSDGDGGPATFAQLTQPTGIAIDSYHNLYVADTSNHKIRMVNSAGIITTCAGTGSSGGGGDGGPATLAQFASPTGLALDISGNVYIADSSNNKIRMVNSAGIITTFAGAGLPSGGGDYGPATNAYLSFPVGLSVDVNCNLYIADAGNNKIRLVSSTGIITTFAGKGIAGSSGDLGAATFSLLNYPTGVALDNIGNAYIVDSNNYRIRLVNSTGIITTYAGTGIPGSNGDGGIATSAQLYNPYEAALDKSGNLYIADAFAHVIRIVKRACPAGAYMSGSNCLLCAAGTYNPSIGATTATTCITCPDSLFSQSDASQCTTASPTPSPSYTPVPSTSASPSPPPSYAPGSGASVTVQCVQV